MKALITKYKHRSLGGMEADSGQSVAAWGLNVGSKLAQGVSKIYSNIFSSATTPPAGSKSPTTPTCHTSGPPSAASSSASGTDGQKGIVTVLDIIRVYDPERDEVNLAEKIFGVVAHFVAHTKVQRISQFFLHFSLIYFFLKNRRKLSHWSLTRTGLCC